MLLSVHIVRVAERNGVIYVLADEEVEVIIPRGCYAL
jgi:hypothetical protein